jgi:hypothetical protein
MVKISSQECNRTVLFQAFKLSTLYHLRCGGTQGKETDGGRFEKHHFY